MSVTVNREFYSVKCFPGKIIDSLIICSSFSVLIIKNVLMIFTS